MAFDQGSFWGGVVGAAGAFAATYSIYYLQRRSTLIRERVELRNSILRACRDIQADITHTATASEFAGAMRQTIPTLEGMLPLAS